MAKEQTLWNTNEIQDSVKLLMPEDKMYNECLDWVNNELDETLRNTVIRSLKNWLKNKNVVVGTTKGKVVNHHPVEHYFNQRKPKASDAYGLIAFFFADSSNLRQMLEQDPPAVVSTIKRLLNVYYLPMSKICETEEGKALVTCSSSWYGTTYATTFPWFSIYNQHIPSLGPTPFLGITKAFFRFFMRAYTEIPALQQNDSPEEKGLKVLSTEAAMFDSFPIVCNLFNKNILKMSTSQKMTVSTVRKCAKMTSLEEFFPDSKETQLNLLRANFALLFFEGIMEYRECAKLEEKPLEELMSQFAYNIYQVDAFMPLILPHVKGLHLRDIYMDSYHILLKIIWQILMNIEQPEQWTSVKNIVKYVICQNMGYEALHVFTIYDMRSNKFCIENKRFNNTIIHFENLYEEIMVPAVKGALLLLASAGLLDVAYRDYRTTDRSWMDWLEYVRPTDLGAYVFGLTPHYERKNAQQATPYFDVDPDRLIVRSLVKGNPFEKFVEEISQPIGNSRYVFSPEQFMKNSDSYEDVQQKIDFLKKYVIEGKEPIRWTIFFTDLVVRCNSLISSTSIGYQVFRLNHKNKDLLHLLTSDEKLRQWVIRAEGYLLLVEDQNMDKFSKRLKALGYML